MTDAMTIPLAHSGRYSLERSVQLAASAAFTEGARQDAQGKFASLDVAFVVDGTQKPVAVSVRQDVHGLRAVPLANPDHVPNVDIARQVKRILCLDVDGAGFDAVAERDPVVAKLAVEMAGVRPVRARTRPQPARSSATA